MDQRLVVALSVIATLVVSSIVNVVFPDISIGVGRHAGHSVLVAVVVRCGPSAHVLNAIPLPQQPQTPTSVPITSIESPMHCRS